MSDDVGGDDVIVGDVGGETACISLAGLACISRAEFACISLAMFACIWRVWLCLGDCVSAVYLSKLNIKRAMMEDRDTCLDGSLYIHIYVHPYIHTYVHIYIHAYTCD